MSEERESLRREPQFRSGRPEGVAQTSSLLYRGFPIRRADRAGTACRLEVGDTAGWKPALRGLGSQVTPLSCGIYVLAVLLLLPGGLFGSPANALREYKDGKYEQSLKDYQQLLERKGDDSRLHFNAGAAAYRNHQFDEAAKQFDDAAVASDLRLQGMAYYNRGNTLYYLGEHDPDPSKRGETWKKSVQDFQNSLKLNPQDKDARFNLEFVKKKLEELKQQQQQSQKNKSDQQPDQDQQKQPPQDQDQQKQQPQQQDQQNQKPGDQKQPQPGRQKQPDQSQQDQQSAAQKQDEQKQQQAAQAQEQKPEAKQAASQPKDSDEKDKEQPAAAAAAGQMTPQQARQLLDAQKGEEMVLPPNPKAKPSDLRRPFKDW